MLFKDRLKQIILKLFISLFSGLSKLIKPVLFFLSKIFWPIKLIWRLFFKIILVNLYYIYLLLKRFGQKIFKPTSELISPVAEQKGWQIILFKNLPIFFLILFAIWTIFDQVQLKKLTAEEIGKKSLLNLITTSPEEYESSEKITEGPITNTNQEKISYLEEEALESPPPPAPKTAEGLAMTSQEETVLIAPPSNLPEMSTRTETINYEVQPGDTISTIAQKFDLNISTILWTNNLSYNSLIRPGQILKILPISGTTHQVKKGENLAAIAKKYQADINKILEFNKLADATAIYVGQTLIIPGGIKPATYVPPAPSSFKNIFTPRPVDLGTRLLWPLISRRISQYFRWRHTGIDIGDKKGNPIYAAENGKVERAGWTSGYGYNVVINHGNGMKTLYGHASRLYVKAGDSVSRGQVIAAIGSTGWSTGPHLHFEVIVNGIKVNPLGYVR